MTDKPARATSPLPMSSTGGGPEVLIVGAGAVGVSLGYHLTLSGAHVTFLVRAGRIAAFDRPQRIYDYDTEAVDIFSAFNVADNARFLREHDFRFVIVTLDGASSRSPEGTKTLQQVGRLIRDTETPVLMNGMGLGLRDFYAQTLDVPQDRLLRGFLGTLAHQARAGILTGQPAALPPESVDICIKHPPSRVGYRIAKSGPAAVKEFAEMYSRSGVSRCVTIDRRIVDVVGNAAFPLYAVSELAGWPSFEDLIATHPELWQLAVDAQREILRTPSNGWFGKLASLTMGPRVTSRIHRKMEQDMKPLELQAFNKFHHGGKVREQDIRILRECAEDGLRQSHSMPALLDLLNRLEHRSR
ncbi:ketopantoate reductase family protein [Rhodococcoides fascians]|uniref:ketopantoate reductase family protein n=1 Tax=Rhodococcoides fascians TaxID=1828 RepID=UPI0009B87C33|nr:MULTISPECIES: 2-dehydropantoate 2-reductase N-terminal domain-containing protein [Rhodococcus]OZF06337.1 hypothetical protein CH301_02110 [Rhodococcus sp. 15-1189-1-1a]OZF21105.1 hypothetical protein CH299_02495 [Rhodococcus sp. 14-2686-1-2]